MSFKNVFRKEREAFEGEIGWVYKNNQKENKIVFLKFFLPNTFPPKRLGDLFFGLLSYFCLLIISNT
jgi:hypothetical protein